MKQILLPLVFMLMPVVASAQQSAHPQVSAPVEQSLRFGYFSYEEVLHTMPGYAPSILEKRQAELRELMAKNVTFKAEAVRLLQQADADAYAPLKAQIDAAVQKVGKVKGLAFILNTDKGAFPYVNALCGEDVTLLIKENLK